MNPHTAFNCIMNLQSQLDESTQQNRVLLTAFEKLAKAAGITEAGDITTLTEKLEVKLTAK